MSTITLTPPQERRRTAFKALCEELRIQVSDNPDHEHYSYSGSEDAHPYVHGQEPITGPWCIVTEHDGDEQCFAYAYPGFHDLKAAQARGAEFIDDDMFDERPLFVVNLDTSERYHATITFAVEWDRRDG